MPLCTGSVWFGVACLELVSRVPCSDLRVAGTADDFEVVVLAKGVCKVAFRGKEALAVIAPGLKVVGFGAVLDEAQHTVCLEHVMAANDGIDCLVMPTASSNGAGSHVMEASGGQMRLFCEA